MAESKAKTSRPSRRIDISEEDLERGVSWNVGFPPDALSEEEEILLPNSVLKRQEAYVSVRNHVLARWRCNVNRYMNKEDAASKIAQKHRDLVHHAWHILDTLGFINFGINMPVNASSSTRDPKETVIVIGAGLAGCAAANQLQRWGYKVVLLEGRNRPGGRVHTARLEGGDCSGVVDLGGSIITGIDGNPLAVLARQLDVPMHGITSRCPLYLEGGKEPEPDVDEMALKQHDALLEECTGYRDSMGDSAQYLSLGTAFGVLRNKRQRLEDPQKDEQLQRMLHWHLANAEFANAACLKALSLSHWDQDDAWEMMGEHVFLPGGNLRLVEGLIAKTPIFYNAVVESVDYSGGSNGPVVVNSTAGTFIADAVVVTVPLGVLKHNVIKFNPALPEEKRLAIRRLGFGILNKVALLFPHVFWDDTCDTFGFINKIEDPTERGMFYLFYQYSGLGGGAVLAALVAGEAAIKFEDVPADVAVARVMSLLRDIHEPKGITVPDPLQAVCTRWGRDPLSYGSYSSVAVGSTGSEDYDAMAASVSDRLFFAGEATIKKWPATMHGAFLSGLREAAKVAQAFRTTHKTRKAALFKEDPGAALSPSSSEVSSSDAEDSDDSHGGRRQRHKVISGKRSRGAGLRNGGSPSLLSSDEGAVEEEEEDLIHRGSGGKADWKDRADPEAGARLAKLVVDLDKLFKSEEPDLEFGIFSVFYVEPNHSASVVLRKDESGPSPSDSEQEMEEEAVDLKDLALVKVDLASMRNGPPSCAMHHILSRSQVAELRDVRGGDEARLTLFSSPELGVKILGRQQLDPRLSEVLKLIANTRGLNLNSRME